MNIHAKLTLMVNSALGTERNVMMYNLSVSITPISLHVILKKILKECLVSGVDHVPKEIVLILTAHLQELTAIIGLSVGMMVQFALRDQKIVVSTQVAQYVIPYCILL